MKWILLLPSFILCLSCGKQSPQQQNDQLYSRHLQTQVPLTIINTDLPSDKSSWNLLILNDGQDVGRLELQEMLDSLNNVEAIGPMVVVAVHATDREQIYGVAGRPDFAGRGKRAEFYDAFVSKELIPFIQKKSGTKKFKSIAVAGFSLGGLSAFDLAWNHPDKIKTAGVFSGSFWWRDKDVTDSGYSNDRNRIMYAKLKASRRIPDQRFWFYAGNAEETSDRDKDGIVDVVDDTQDIIQWLREKKKLPASSVAFVTNPSGKHDWPYWKEAFPKFLVWAFPKK